jgi:hypothetical protein
MKHHITDPKQIEKSENGRLGIIARTIAYEILKLPHVCEICGLECRTEVHHINKDRKDNTRENIMILCRSCHNKKHDVILPKKEKLFEQEVLEQLPVPRSNHKYNSKSRIYKEKRRMATLKYRERWGITD